MKKLLCLLVCLVFVITLVGCGGGGGQGSKNSTAGLPSSIIVIPNSASVIFGGGKQQFTAKVLDNMGHVVSSPTLIWTMKDNDKTCGNVSSTGLFTSSNTTGTAGVKCQVAGTSVSITVPVIVGKLKVGGPQFVSDVHAAMDNEGIIFETRMPDLLSHMDEQLTPNIALVKNAMYEAFYAFHNANLLFLFGEYNGFRNYTNYTTVLPWTCSYGLGDGHGWVAIITRVQSGLNDVVTFNVAPDPDPRNNPVTYHPKYKIVITYPTALLLGEDFATNGISKFNVTISLANDYLNGPTTFSGLMEANILKTKYSHQLEPLGIHLNGALSSTFKNGNYIKFNGDINIQDILTAGSDHLTGTLETANLLLSGNFQINYTPNTYLGVIPSGIIMNGTFQTKDADPVILKGLLDLEAKNAATVDYMKSYSATNFLHAYFNFNGLIQADKADALQETFTFEEKGYNLYSLIEKVQLSTGGLARSVTINISNSFPTAQTSAIRIDITSSWGPAFLRVNLGFNEPLPFGQAPDTVTGALYLNKTGPVEPHDANISKSGDSIIITYKDQTTETL